MKQLTENKRRLLNLLMDDQHGPQIKTINEELHRKVNDTVYSIIKQFSSLLDSVKVINEHFRYQRITA